MAGGVAFGVVHGVKTTNQQHGDPPRTGKKIIFPQPAFTETIYDTKLAHQPVIDNEKCSTGSSWCFRDSIVCSPFDDGSMDVVWRTHDGIWNDGWVFFQACFRICSDDCGWLSVLGLRWAHRGGCILSLFWSRSLCASRRSIVRDLEGTLR